MVERIPFCPLYISCATLFRARSAYVSVVLKARPHLPNERYNVFSHVLVLYTLKPVVSRWMICRLRAGYAN